MVCDKSANTLTHAALQQLCIVGLSLVQWFELISIEVWFICMVGDILLASIITQPEGASASDW
ncbi:hypothetical protein DA72_03145 [Vibrio cholerae O1 biovar El Tor]|nr:hypothetical protein O3Y_14683 [Vibrio cholerae IEC224]AIT31224.1 hypothetical protein EN18_00035 [Vibrio cholerae]AJZ97863.1 hypothetical protein IR04_01165 [Vibrio cholerae O1 biovar El Tor]KEH80431.1 hypothetical protein DA72_03145 [Vibrio cholerae O1 biovar El Tor]KEH81641.1 hypothetical protein DA44_15480 [Vibrio cholerae O1 biovar El Tor]